jgi:ATP:corrinoid adenosyltransferase
MQEKLEGVELIIAGTMADPRVIEEARPVMEMKGIKHCHQQGIKAKSGIEK